MKYNKIILISIDALSRDYQSLFEDYFTTKYINYRTTNTWTLPSHIAMLSGLALPGIFKVANSKEFDKYKDFVANIPTVATLLHQFGFKSRAITGGGFMSKYFGWGNDWDKWEESEDNTKEWKGEKILPRKNELLFLHTYYVHNWFDENKKLKREFFEYRDKLENKEKVDEKKFKVFINKGKKWTKLLPHLTRLNLPTK